jgi:hypothetical protein
LKSIGTTLESRVAEAIALLHRIGRHYPSAALASSLIDAACDNTAAEGLIQ